MEMVAPDSLLPLILFALATASVGIGMLLLGSWLGPRRQSAVKQMPYESGMDPIHSARRRFDIRFPSSARIIPVVIQFLNATESKSATANTVRV